MLSWKCVLCKIARVLLWRTLKEFVGYIPYKELWKATVGEVLSYAREARNAPDRFAVAMKITGATDTVEHLLT